jgi:hypothetical protein
MSKTIHFQNYTSSEHKLIYACSACSLIRDLNLIYASCIWDNNARFNLIFEL